MRRVVIDSAGGHDKLRFEEAPTPEPAAGEVLVRCQAIGVNYADCVVRMGLYASAKKYVGWPITPGFEVAGTVERVGAGVQTPTPGDDVIAVTRFGGYATHVCVPSHQVFARPRGFDALRAAGFPVIFLTAHHALFDLAQPAPGAQLLVHSAAGGVGSALLQLARLAECRAVGVVGASHKVDAARRLGARAVIDKSKEPLWQAAERHSPGGYHAIFDANGPTTLRQSYEHLRPMGRLVVYGFHSMMPRSGGRPRYSKLAVDWMRMPRFDPLQLTGENKSVMGFNLSYLFAEKQLLARSMARVCTWADEGRLVAPPTTEYALSDVARAHADLESGQTVGKLVLVP